MAVLTHQEIADRLGVTRQAAAKLEASALVKLRTLAALADVFPRSPGEKFPAWWGRLRAVLSSVKSATAKPPPQPKTNHARLQTNRNPRVRRV